MKQFSKKMTNILGRYTKREERSMHIWLPHPPQTWHVLKKQLKYFWETFASAVCQYYWHGIYNSFVEVVTALNNAIPPKKSIFKKDILEKKLSKRSKMKPVDWLDGDPLWSSIAWCWGISSLPARKTFLLKRHFLFLSGVAFMRSSFYCCCCCWGSF